MELRKDYFLERWVVVSRRRGKRPYDFKQPEDIHDVEECEFCPGMEGRTPPEIGVLEKDGNWYIRWFSNKYPFVAREGNPLLKNQGLFTSASAFGEHEVVVEVADHNKQLHDLPVEHIKDILSVYTSRIRELEKRNVYVVVFKNHGRAAGTSRVHSHTQIAAISMIPPTIKEEVEKSHVDGKCLYCDIIRIEKDSDRMVFENENFVSFCPYASRFNFEMWIFPKQHIKGLNEMNDNQLTDLAEILKKVLTKLAKLNAAYNYVLHYAPKGKDLHFHIEVLPRISIFGGFEYSSGIIVNQIMPEDAAKFYREG